MFRITIDAEIILLFKNYYGP